ncbi:MAG: RNA polymerase sigma factor [Candidatus Saccharimonadales bacterium]|jgi:RNA polymerase sigma-70 factor (ECF subfamily)
MMTTEFNLQGWDHVEQDADLLPAAEAASDTDTEAQAFVGQDIERPVIPRQLQADRDDEALAIRPPETAEYEEVLTLAQPSASDLPMAGRVISTSEAGIEDSDDPEDEQEVVNVNGRLLTSAQEAEFNRMYIDYNTFLLGVVRRMGVSEQDAEDIVQDTYINAARAGSGRIFDPESDDNERAYLTRTAQNAAINAHRRGQRKKEPPRVTDPESNEIGLATAAQPGPSVEQVVVSNAAREQIFTEWRGLMPDRHFQILIMTEYYGMQYKEAAENLGIPIGTVMSSLSRAKGKIRAYEAQKAAQA